MSNPTVIEKIRAALGRTAPLQSSPTPPALDEPITRLVHSDFGLPELFAKSSADNGMEPEMVYVDALPEKLIDFLHRQGAKKIAMPRSSFLQKLGVAESLRAAGFDVRHWPELTLDELYDFDASVTDAYAAIAETGSVVVRASANHGRALSLVPPVHVVILEPKNFLADLVDLFQKLTHDNAATEGIASAVSIITGPSRTGDIEMTLCVGVHGPLVVKAFVLQ